MLYFISYQGYRYIQMVCSNQLTAGVCLYLVSCVCRLEHITKPDNSLHITLTRSSPLSGETAPFKVITKVGTCCCCCCCCCLLMCTQMRLEHNKHKCIEVYRSHGDFYWLFSALQVETNFLFVVCLFVCLLFT